MIYISKVLILASVTVIFLLIGALYLCRQERDEYEAIIHAGGNACTNAVQMAVALHRTEDIAADMYLSKQIGPDMKKVLETVDTLRIQFNKTAILCLK